MERWHTIAWDTPPNGRMIYDVDKPVHVEETSTFERLWAMCSGEETRSHDTKRVPKTYWATPPDKLLAVRVAPSRAVLAFSERPTEEQVRACADRFCELEGHYPNAVVV